MEDYCRLPRPLSLSSDDLLHEAERMFATKFVSRFPSPENVITAHAVSRDVKSDEAVDSLSLHIPIVTTFCAILPSSVVANDSTNRTRSVSDVYALTGAPTIEDDEQYHVSTEMCTKDCIVNGKLSFDMHGPLQVQNRVEIVMHKWGPVEPINPELFFFKLLASRGYNSELIPALASQYNR